MSTEDQLQYPTTLESFEKERARYRPIDLIDFSIEYFKALQNGTPLKYHDLSGLDKFVLKPENGKIIQRLQIPDEDLYRVILRRKPISEKEFLSKFNEELSQFNEIIDSSNDEEFSKQEMHQYLKYKTKIFKEKEFLRFLDGLEKLPLKENDKRIYFTKYFNLNDDEKKAVTDLLSLDYKIMKNVDIENWKNTLIKMEKASHHTYAPYDNKSYKLEEFCKKIDNNEEFDINDAEVLYSNYLNLIDEMKNMNESEIYHNFITRYQFIRVIIYCMIKIKSKNDESLKDLFEKVDKIFNNSFSYLTTLDYYDFIISPFIPLLKNTDPISQEYREMESFINNLMPQIPYIYNVNFEEEKSLYYNLECVKYLLKKESKIKELSLKKILIQLIDIFAKKVNDLKQELKITNPIDISILFNDKLQLLTLQLNEFYPNLVKFTDKLISIAIKYNMKDSNVEIRESMISEFKAYSHIDQILITNSMKMRKMFEIDEIKQKGINDAIELLIKSLSIPEMNDVIITNKRKDEEVILPLVKNYYIKCINTPRYNFNHLKYIKFKHQNQIISLIIKNNKNLENTAKVYDSENIEPYLNCHNMIEEIFNFNNLFFKLKFDKSMNDLLQNDGQALMNKFKDNYKKEYEFINSLPSNLDDECINKFKEFNCFQQKLILTYLNFIDNFNIDNKYLDIIRSLSIIYLQPKVDYLNKLILTEKQVKPNQIFFEGIYDDLRHVNYPIYIYVKYDRDINFFITFTNDEKKLIEKIDQALNLNSKYQIPICYSFNEMLSNNNLEEISKDLKDNHKLMNEFIKLYDPNNSEQMITDFSLFNSDERKVIIKILNQKEGKNTSILKNYDDKTKDDEMFILKKIAGAEADDDLTKSNDEFGNDVKNYYRKKLIELEKNFPKSKISFITNVLEYPYDPNYKYLYDNFNTFSQIEKISIVKDILSKMKIMESKTYYFDDLVVIIMEDILKKLIDIGNRHNDNEIYMKKLSDEFLYYVRFYDNSVLKFILEIKSVENESIYKFTSNFSDKERKIICLFLELYSIITKNKSYNEFNEDLQNYLTDLPYEERLTFINERLNMILENQIIKYMFIITAELIKETSLEIDYIIEEIMNNDEENLSDLIKNLFETLRIPEREILINTLKCIKQQNNNGKIENYIEELEQMKDNEEKQSIYNNVSDSFEAIKRVLNETRDKNEVFDSFSKLKNTLYGICKDLFYFVDQCKIGKFNFRKIKAISPIKVEIIKKLLDIEYMFKKNNNIKSAIEILKNLKLNEKK